jgi:hypothetical protein
MKRCPNCQRTFADTMKFCQTDGTPLVDDAPAAPPADPYKTMVGSAKNDDILQIPEPPDSLKTMVSSSSDIMDLPKAEPPKPKEPSLNPPPFGDLSPQSGSSSGSSEKPKSFDSTFSNISPPSFGSGGSSSSPFDKPSDAPFGSSQNSSAKDEPPPTAFGGSSPFDSPKPSSVPPPYKDPESFNPSPFGSQQPSYGQSNDPFGAPAQTPFGSQQNDWSPPPAPVASWQDQGVGANTPFQPPVGAGGQNQTLAIVSLVCGIIGLCCGISGIIALITGYMAKNNAEQNPTEYGGRGMAIAGMILGGISIFFMIIGIILQVLGALSR